MFFLSLKRSIRNRFNPQYPTTPNVHEECSKRQFDGRVRAWRRVLHLWDNVDSLRSSTSSNGPNTKTIPKPLTHSSAEDACSSGVTLAAIPRLAVFLSVVIKSPFIDDTIYITARSIQKTLLPIRNHLVNHLFIVKCITAWRKKYKRRRRKKRTTRPRSRCLRRDAISRS